MKKVYVFLTKVSAGIAYVSYAAVIAATLLTVVDVVLRKLFNSAVFGAYELVEFLMVCTVFASFAYTQTRKGHIRVSMFIKKMPRRLAMILYSINELVATAIVCAVTYAAYIQIGYAMKKNLISANLSIPLYPFYAIEMICMGLFAVVLLCDAIFSIMGIFKQEYADEVMSAI